MILKKTGLLFRAVILLALALSACQRTPGPAPLPPPTASAIPTRLFPTQTPTPASTNPPAPQARAGQTHADSYNPRISADGRFIAFDSPGNDLLKWKLPECPDRSWGTLPGQPCWQVYLYDQQAGTTELVSMNRSGEPGNSLSSSAALSSDGRYVAFVSYATNLAGDTASSGAAGTPPANAAAPVGIYLRDRQANTILRVAASGAHPAISADGNWIVYEDSLNGINVIQLYDRQSGKTTLVSRADPSLAATLTPASPAAGSTPAGSSTPAGNGATTPAPTASKTSRPTATRTPTAQPTVTSSPTTRPAMPTEKPKGTAAPSGSATPTGGSATTAAGTAAPTASPTPIGGELGPAWHSVMPSISADGNWIAFWSWDGHLVPGDTKLCNDGQVNCGDLFLFDRVKQKITRVAMDAPYGEGMVFYPTSLSTDGRWLASKDVVYDRLTGRTSKVKITAAVTGSGGRNEVPPTPNAEGIKLSADGRWLEYQVGPRIFVQPAGGGKAEQVTVSNEGEPGTGVLVASTMCTGAPQCQRDPSFSLSADGRYAAFDSTAADLAGDDPWLCAGNGASGGVIPHNCADIFVRDRQTGQTRWITRPALPGPTSGMEPPAAPALPLKRLSLTETSLSPLESGNYRQTDREVWFLSPGSWRFDATVTLPAEGGGVTLQRSAASETEGKTRVYNAQANTLVIRSGSLDRGLPGGPPLYGTSEGLRSLPDLLGRLAQCYPQAAFLGESEEIAGQKTYAIYLGLSKCTQAIGTSPTPGTATARANTKSAEANVSDAVANTVTDAAAEARGPEVIWVEQRSLVVMRWVIQNPDGETSLYQMEVSQIDHNTEIPTGWFTDIAPQGAKIDDRTK